MSRPPAAPALTLPRTAGDRTLVVAEISANHGGSLDRALQVVEAAAAAGADAIKIQSYTPDTLTLDSDRPEFRIDGGPWGGRTLYQLYQEAHTPPEWFPTLRDAAAALGVPLFSTPFAPATVRFLAEKGASAFKVSSFELTDLELLAAVAATRRPVLLSTGMATAAEIAAAVAQVRQVWAGSDHGLCLLHCVSAYPAAPGDMHLATVADLATRFGVVPGLSDHTLGTAVAVAAVALGARVVEKHFTLRRADGGPDSHFSLEPDELRELVAAVRAVEAAVGSVRYGPKPGEQPSLQFRRSIFLVRDVARGQPLTRADVRVIRPGQGLAPRHLPEVLGRALVRDCPAGTPLSWELLA